MVSRKLFKADSVLGNKVIPIVFSAIFIVCTKYYGVLIAIDFIDIIRFNVGDEVTVEYKKGEQVDTVLSLNGKASEQISTKAAKEEQAEDTAGDSAQTE